MTPLKQMIKESLLAYAIAWFLLVIIYFSAFTYIHPEFDRYLGANNKSLTVPAYHFVPISVGDYKKDASGVSILSFKDGEAIFALPRSFVAEHYPFIQVDIQGLTRFTKFKLLWRKQSDQEKTYSLEFNRRQDGVTQLAMTAAGEDYAGEISDVALLFYDGPALDVSDNNGVPIRFFSISLIPYSSVAVAKQIYEDWTTPPSLQGYSNNVVRGVHAGGLLMPNAVANLSVLTGIAVLFLMRILTRSTRDMAEKPLFFHSVMCVCLLGLVFTEILRWHWRIDQLVDTTERYWGKSKLEKIQSNDLRCTRFPEDCELDYYPYF